MTKKTKIRELTAGVLPSRFLSYREYLQAVYQAVKESLDAYSWIQFAEDLGFPKGNALHLVMRGKRRLTNKASDRIIAALDLRHLERQYFEALVRLNNAKDPVEKEKSLAHLEDLKSRELGSHSPHELADKQLRYFSQWFHPVVREAFKLKNFEAKAEWIARHIHPRLRENEVEASIKLLQELGLVTENLQLAQSDVTTPEGGADMAIYLYLKRMTELGTDALMNLPDHRRDISAVTIAGSQATIDKIKEEISLFQKRLLELSEADTERDQILHVNIQLFPFTKE